MGGICFNDDACAAGKCSAIDGAQGTCVRKTDSDCGSSQWCDAGLAAATADPAAAASSADAATLTDWVYRDLFQMPPEDPWLGLRPAAFDALSGPQMPRL